MTWGQLAEALEKIARESQTVEDENARRRQAEEVVEQ